MGLHKRAPKAFPNRNNAVAKTSASLLTFNSSTVRLLVEELADDPNLATDRMTKFTQRTER
jgi:hypothetical protein